VVNWSARAEAQSVLGIDRDVIAIRQDLLEGEWNAYVDSHPDASLYHRAEWSGVIARVFRHKTAYLAATAAGRVVGVLPLVSFASPLFGRFATSMPFLNYGGVLADSPEVAEALLAAAVEHGHRTRAKYIELRHTARLLPSLPVQTHKVAMILTLHGSVEAQWQALDRKLRNQVRKAEKTGLTTVTGGLELLDAFYDVLTQNMRDLGSPVHDKRFFADVLETFPANSRILCVMLNDRPVAASIVLWHGGQIEVPWASAIRQYNPLCPNVLLYWEMLKFAIERRFARFDFGRSTPNEGTFNFKQQWGAEPRHLYWEYWLADGESLPDRSPKNPKFGSAIAVWQRLPVALTRMLGPRIVRFIP
jgi:FemAB-related protein (PEP-CTERM system-associated)